MIASLALTIKVVVTLAAVTLFAEQEVHVLQDGHFGSTE
jgi:hypothetical protein